MENFPQHQSHEAYIFLTSNKFIEKAQKGDTALAQWKYTKDEPKRKRIKRNTIYTELVPPHVQSAWGSTEKGFELRG